MAVRTEDPQVEISKLIYRYAHLIDSGDFDGVGRLFEHAVIDFGGGGTLQGSEAIAAMYAQSTRRYEDDGTPHTRHVTTNLIIDVDENETTATSMCYVVVFQRLDDFPLQPVWTNRYHDEFAFVDGVWRFTRRTMADHKPGDVSRHLYGDY